MLRALTFALALIVVAAQANADDRSVYRWIDDQGNVHFSDRPQSEEAEATGLTSRRTDPERVATARAKPIGAPSADAPGETAGTDQDGKLKEEDEGDRAARFAENCRRAQAALQSIVNARRLYLPTDDGSRRYLDQAETDARRTKAEADVREWCR